MKYLACNNRYRKIKWKDLREEASFRKKYRYCMENDLGVKFIIGISAKYEIHIQNSVSLLIVRIHASLAVTPTRGSYGFVFQANFSIFQEIPDFKSYLELPRNFSKCFSKSSIVVLFSIIPSDISFRARIRASGSASVSLRNSSIVLVVSEAFSPRNVMRVYRVWRSASI